jgi:hypothetical protein
MQKLAAASEAVQQLLGSCSQATATEALSTVSTILRNLAEHPGEPRYSQLRTGNAAFQRRVGGVPAALQLLAVAGFTAAPAGGGGGGEGVLTYRRGDPGLVWLVLSVVNDALQGAQRAAMGDI